jgi:hypothetical protein
MRRPLCLSLFICAGLLVPAGCRMGVPIHVWQPPQLQSTVGKRVAVSTLVGPKGIASQVKQKLLATSPRDLGRTTELVDAATLQDKTEIQLVSATDNEPNDLALAAVARREEFDFLLRGEVIQDRYPKNNQEPNQELGISWRLTGLGTHSGGGGRPVVVDIDSAIDRYPDLSLNDDAQDVLTSAAVRDTFRLITPSVHRQRVQLAIPYITPGSEAVRRGNAEALASRWGAAEAIWRETIENHPTQTAAIHNLALAAAAAQDFSRAKQLARKAIRRRPSNLHKQTLVWIELTQRDYHKSFGLPDPPEGWFVTNETR